MQLNGGVCNTHLFQQHPSEQQQLLPYLFVDSGHFPPLSFGPIRSFETLGTKFWERRRKFLCTVTENEFESNVITLLNNNATKVLSFFQLCGFFFMTIK